ncbi:V0D/AC39 family V-type ATPase subunit [Treponema parvum]|uniref:V0D/AC39 family V-type ATPase subunit n=1 Tax=Treponema parvum TaxID=138851 RepID=UPI001AEBDD69|nr:V-type ATPase subunit [Treponema parvum]QTQ16710.1 V-type ATPase subunit [Treponema parvum]
MSRSDAAAYVNAKANGMLQKSFVGPKSIKLFSVHSLPELWALLFTEEMPSVPGQMLAEEIERKALREFILQYKKLLAMYPKPDAVSLSLLQYYDYENLKSIATSLYKNEKNMPHLVDISPYNIINYKEWPDLAKITENTPFYWYDKIPSAQDMQALDERLDLQYVKNLWKSIDELPHSERSFVRDFILEDIIFKNIIWAMRLKVYYDMKKDDIIAQLIFAGDHKNEKDLFAAPALAIIDKDVNAYAEWSGWKYEDALNPHEEGTLWTLDPCWVEQSFRRILNRKALKKMHQYPLTAMVMVCWFKIKQNEYETVCAASEALRMGVDETQVMELAGIAPAKQR